MNIDLSDLLKLAEEVKLPTIPTAMGGGSSKLSFGIVNSASNGKRITFSKGLVTALAVTNKAVMLPVKAKDVLMVARVLPFPAAKSVDLKGEDGRKIAYDSEMVTLLTKVFDLTFTKHVSAAYNDITIDTLDDGTPVALIHIFDKHAEDKVEHGENDKPVPVGHASSAPETGGDAA